MCPLYSKAPYSTLQYCEVRYSKVQYSSWLGRTQLATLCSDACLRVVLACVGRRMCARGAEAAAASLHASRHVLVCWYPQHLPIYPGTRSICLSILAFAASTYLSRLPHAYVLCHVIA
jgi:hypothetical protein